MTKDDLIVLAKRTGYSIGAEGERYIDIVIELLEAQGAAITSRQIAAIIIANAMQADKTPPYCYHL